MKVHIGCSGWSYKAWRYDFYPKKVAKKDWLAFYAKTFSTVEVNNSFYQLPKKKTLKKWQESVPKGFEFIFKGSRYITHLKKLKIRKKNLEKFYDAISPVSENVSGILWQLPGNQHRDDEKLENFCKLLFNKYTHFIEFRHDSWFDEKVYKILKDHKIGFCSLSFPDLPEEPIVTNGTAYIRFHGKGEDLYNYDYSDKELKDWYIKIVAANPQNVFAFFNNTADANAPKNGQYFISLFDN